MIGYKVVKRINSQAFGPCTKRALQKIRYRIGKETKQDSDNHGPFAVFEDKEQAIDFLNYYGDVLLEVEYQTTNENRLWKKSRPVFVKNRYGKGYHYESNGIETKESDFPKGTVFASSITPIKIIMEF